MEKASNCFLQLVVILGLVAACTPPEPALPNHPVEITGVPEELTVDAYATIGPLPIQAVGQDLLTSFRVLKNGEEIQAFNLSLTGKTVFYTNFSHPASPLDIGKELVFVFEATDANGDVSRSEMRVSVTDLPNSIRVASDISSDQTWESGKTYILSDRISVLSGATLTLQKGVLVKTGVGEGDTPPLLVIERGAKIMANGTAEEPIIFASILDGIQPGQLKSSISPQWPEALDSWVWGGLVILGKAKGSFVGDVSEVSLQGEGGIDYGLVYGGEDNQDNSGILNYVSIRNIGPLTLAAVGSGTQIDKVEVYQGRQGVRILGGVVSLDNIIVGTAATGLSIDQGWNGRFENFYFVNCWTSAIDVKGPKGSYYDGNNQIRKGSIVVPYGNGILNFEENSNADLSKIYFEITGLRSEMTFPGEGISYWINRVPSLYMSEVSELEVYSHSPITSSLFLSWSDRVKLLSSPAPSVGVDLEAFKKWAIIL